MKHLFVFLLVFLNATTAIAQQDEAPTWEPGDSPAFHRPLSELANLKLPDKWQEGAPFESLQGVDVALPSHFDWRQGPPGLSPVRDQGQHGCCWAFSITATAEDILNLTGVPQALSQEYLVDCNTNGYNCRIGGFFQATDLLVNPGTVSAAQYPYEGETTSCKAGLKYGEKISSWAYIGSSGGVPPTEDIKKAIYMFGPVAVGVSVTNSFAAYKSGIFNSCANTQINHAVNLVGWDDATNSWIMRNSWGATWGEEGYMRIKYGCSSIGYAANFQRFRLEPNPNANPTPTPSPTVTPSPTPTVTPSPTPTVTPTPCEPQAHADAGEDVQIPWRAIFKKCATVGTKALPGHTYSWDSVDISVSGKKAQIKVCPQKRGTYRYVVYASTACGADMDEVIVTVK